MNYEKLYFKLPIFLQTILVNLQGFRLYRRRFAGDGKKILQHYMQSDITAVNIGKLKNFLLAAQRSPFWQKRFAEYNVDLNGNFDPIKEIAKLPLLTKQEVRDNWEDIAISDALDTFHVVTSGSTGTALTVVHTLTSEKHQWAVWERDRRTHGVGIDTWMGWFGGKPIVPQSQTTPPYWRTCYPLKQIMFSISHLNDQTVTDYFYKIKKARLPWLHGYPSQLCLLASLIKKHKLGKLPDLKLISIGSESLLPHQKQLLEEVLGVPVRQCYGLAEGVAAITEDRDGKLMLNQDFAYVELLPFEAGSLSERRIVGTNYNNLAFPLIRYFTGDVATVDQKQDVLSNDGRIDDYICFPDGTKIGRLSHMFKVTKNICEAQVYQPDLESLVLRIVKSSSYCQVDEDLILKEAAERFGDRLQVKLEYLESIPKTRTGKLRLVVSDVASN